MKEFIINENEAGQRFDKYLGKLLREAPKSFFYKMLRKKNITLNGGRATGNEKLSTGDHVKLFLSDETFGKFAGVQETAARAHQKLDIVYEDDNILLDRNTSGLVAAGKSLAGLQELSSLFHDRSLHKFYRCLVNGVIKNEKYIKGYLHKDEKCNKVTVQETETSGALPIETRYRPLGDNGTVTLLEVELITGRTHQIRAHLAGTGHPLIGDYKYGRRTLNDEYCRKYGLKSQLLHAYRLEIPEIEGRLSYLSGKEFTAPLPYLFQKILKEEHVEENK